MYFSNIDRPSTSSISSRKRFNSNLIVIMICRLKSSIEKNDTAKKFLLVMYFGCIVKSFIIKIIILIIDNLDELIILI